MGTPIVGQARTTPGTGFVVILRVEDPQDYTAVIEIPHAAAIDRGLRGRGYARIQRGAVVQFQGGYVGGPVPAPVLRGPP